MHQKLQRRRPGPRREPDSALSVAESSYRELGPGSDAILRIQRLAGNHAVASMVEEWRRAKAEESSPGYPVERQAAGEIAKARGQGFPLAQGARAEYENEFGPLPAGIRIHDDRRAHLLAESVDARAFSSGRDIFFRAGAYDPASGAGQALLAHELTHTVSDGRHRPPGHPHVLHVQRQAAGSPSEQLDIKQEDAELDQLLAEIDKRFPTPTVPAFEVITATTTAEYSYGELEGQIEKFWVTERLSFTPAARRAAQGNPAAATGGAVATQSPEIRPSQPYAARRAIAFIAADYRKGGSDLPAIKRLLRKGSPYQKSLAAEFDKVVSVEDPTAADMKSQISGAIIGMFETLPAGHIGELGVSFSGHGGGGHIMGVDGEYVRREELADLAKFGADWGVHLIYYLDTCRGGALVSPAQKSALAGAAGEAFRLAPGQQESVRSLAAFGNKIADLKGDIMKATYYAGNAARAYRKRHSDANTLTLFKKIGEDLSTSLTELEKGLKGSDTPKGIPPISAIEQGIAGVRKAMAVAIISVLREGVQSVLRATALLLDGLNDFLNALIAQLHQMVSSKPLESPGSH